MSKCGGDCCGGCQSGDVCCDENEDSYAERESIDSKYYLRPPKRPDGDPTPLEEQCKCPDNPRLPRYACIKCIRGWVASQNYEDVLNKSEELKLNGKLIAAERLLKELEKQK